MGLALGLGAVSEVGAEVLAQRAVNEAWDAGFEEGQRVARTEGVGRQLLTVAEAAEHVGSTQRFIRKLIEERRVRYFKVGGWMVRLDRADLDALFEPVERVV